MYEVSERYKTAQAAQIRGSCYAELDLCRLDGKAQARLLPGFLGACVAGCVPARVTDMTAFPRPVASFEPDWLRVDGSQTFAEDPAAPPPYYISEALSADTAQNGGYPITGQSLDAQLPGGFPRGLSLTWQFDGAFPAAASWSFDGVRDGSRSSASGFSKLVVALPEDRTVTTVSVQITALNRPTYRLRVARLYAGTVDNCTGRDLLSLKISDINDGIGLELPERKLTVSLRNTAGLTTESEYLSPTYRAADTQAILRVGMDVDGSTEWVPMGRFFLSEYQVDENSIDLTFWDALGLLSQYTHHWAGPVDGGLPLTLADHIDQVLYPVGYDLTSDNIPLPSPGRDYALKLRNTGRGMAAKPTAPCARVSCADALRLYASVSGNLVRGCRADYDLSMQSYGRSSNRVITRYELYTRPVWRSDEAIRSIDIEQRSPEFPEVQVNLLESGTYTVGQAYTVYCDQEIGNLYCRTDSDWVLLSTKADIIGGTLYAKQFTPTATFTGDIGVYYRPYSTPKVTYTPSGVAQGEAKTLSNPVIGWTAGGSRALEYGELIYQELRRPMITELSHRGFPELDAGDIVQLQIEPGQTAQVRVLENTVEIKAGAMSGKTRVRLMQ